MFMKFLLCQISLHALGRWVLFSYTLFWWKTASIETSGWLVRGTGSSCAVLLSAEPRGVWAEVPSALLWVQAQRHPSPRVWIIRSFGQALGANLQFGCCDVCWHFWVWFGLTDTRERAQRRLLSPPRLGRGRRALPAAPTENSPDAPWGIP